jgi:hypothetical protein
MSDRVPTKNQYDRLRALADPGCILVSGIGGERRVWKSLIAHGWVVPKNPERDPENGLQITPVGLRALAAYIETYGPPEWAPALVARAGMREQGC